MPRRKVLRGGREIDLTSREFLLLSLLARRSGEVLSKNFIAEQVWDINFESDSNPIEVAIRRLRKKIDDPFERLFFSKGILNRDGIRMKTCPDHIQAALEVCAWTVHLVYKSHTRNSILVGQSPVRF